ncbi:hypothetical protein [Candidatus Halobonum tyrrellensis]|uniref:Uncharacterized protein n=1 Tax=Candidatus Halobonum tyrrellensis G22 TaxID=1324957 RepID=V4GPD8_9EURY|nr:hypothetical protein [Candidatus Halobonum tyrrellensis]ESP87246.1 hypothetical protein K933_15314 [Candidatus Halobonum tyrrellensis G22]
MTDEGRQATFGADGDLSDRSPDADGTDDFGEPKGSDETDGGYNRFAVSSLLQKAVRRSDEEVAAWAAWELARSGFAWNLWDRLNLYVVEDLRAGQEVALLVDRYEELATERWEPSEWKGRVCAVHAALACARARSSRESSNADEYFRNVAAERAAANEEDREPNVEFPAGDLEPGGRFDVAFDKHTGEGARMGRGGRFFKLHGARVGPEGEDDQSARWQRTNMELRDEEFSAAEIEHALSAVDPDDRWAEPDFDGGSDEERPDGTDR